MIGISLKDALESHVGPLGSANPPNIFAAMTGSWCIAFMRNP